MALQAGQTTQLAGQPAPEAQGTVHCFHHAADAQAIAAILNGDTQRFAELIERNKRAVFAVVRGYVADPDAAEDVAQDIFLKAFVSLKTLRQPDAFLGWLLQIARNTAAQAGMRSDNRPDRFSLEQTKVRQSSAPPAASPTGILAKVEELAEPYRSTLFLRYQANLSCKQIAEKEGVAVSTITSRLSRGLLILRTALKES